MGDKITFFDYFWMEVALVEFAFQTWGGKYVWCVKNIGKL